MRSGLKKVSKMMKKLWPRKRSEKSEMQKRRSLTRNFALESQVWRADIEKLCREFNQNFENRKISIPRRVQRRNAIRTQKSLTQV